MLKNILDKLNGKLKIVAVALLLLPISINQLTSLVRTVQTVSIPSDHSGVSEKLLEMLQEQTTANTKQAGSFDRLVSSIESMVGEMKTQNTVLQQQQIALENNTTSTQDLVRKLKTAMDRQITREDLEELKKKLDRIR